MQVEFLAGYWPIVPGGLRAMVKCWVKYSMVWRQSRRQRIPIHGFRRHIMDILNRSFARARCVIITVEDVTLDAPISGCKVNLAQPPCLRLAMTTGTTVAWITTDVQKC